MTTQTTTIIKSNDRKRILKNIEDTVNKAESRKVKKCYFYDKNSIWNCCDGSAKNKLYVMYNPVFGNCMYGVEAMVCDDHGEENEEFLFMWNEERQRWEEP